jgi:hypothetical protein
MKELALAILAVLNPEREHVSLLLFGVALIVVGSMLRRWIGKAQR